MPVPIRLATPADVGRRRALASLAEAVRRVNDAVATTAVGDEALAVAETQVRRAVAILGAEHDEDPYSGLMMPRPEWSDPATILPLSPIVGAFSPIRPEVEMHLVEGGVRGTAQLERKHVGPPGYAHGGVAALIADQLVALVQVALGVSGVTRQLSLRYHRPVPLHTQLLLVADGALEGDLVHATGSIAAGEEVCVRIDAELAVRDPRRLSRRQGG
jgi:acyl-coenzyme A thioesterase PaaI-like protein